MAYPGSSFLNDNPQAAYMGAMPSVNPSQRRFLSGQYGNIYGEYQGALGQQAQSMMLPSLTFDDFLKRYPWLQYMEGFAPRQRGVYQSQFAPPARFLNF